MDMFCGFAAKSTENSRSVNERFVPNSKRPIAWVIWNRRKLLWQMSDDHTCKPPETIILQNVHGCSPQRLLWALSRFIKPEVPCISKNCNHSFPAKIRSSIIIVSHKLMLAIKKAHRASAKIHAIIKLMCCYSGTTIKTNLWCWTRG